MKEILALCNKLLEDPNVSYDDKVTVRWLALSCINAVKTIEGQTGEFVIRP